MSGVVPDDGRLATAQRYSDIGQHERVLEVLARLDPEIASSAEAIWLRGFAHLGLDDFDAAAAVAREGLASEPDDTSLLSLLSSTETLRGDLPAAEQAILAALALEPGDPDLLSQYADVLLGAGQLDKAERILGHAAAADPESSQVLETRITLAHLRHHDRRARKLSRELLARDPDSLSGKQMLGVLEWQHGDTTSASRRFAEVVRADPNDQVSADSARMTQQMSNPAWWPARFLARFGTAPMWVGAIATILSLRALGLETLAVIVTVAWSATCISSWIAAVVFRDR